MIITGYGSHYSGLGDINFTLLSGRAAGRLDKLADVRRLDTYIKDTLRGHEALWKAYFEYGAWPDPLLIVNKDVEAWYKRYVAAREAFYALTKQVLATLNERLGATDADAAVAGANVYADSQISVVQAHQKTLNQLAKDFEGLVKVKVPDALHVTTLKDEPTVKPVADQLVMLGIWGVGLYGAFKAIQLMGK